MAALVRLRHLAAICLCGLLASPAMAETVNKSLIPPPAYQLAAHHADVPSAVLYAIALQESGIHLRCQRVPWPWTLNVAGQPRRFTTRAAACGELQDALDTQPNQRIDVGLGQINVGYHAHRVAHPCDLLDPYRNLRIAATILREQYRQGEDWLPAMAAITVQPVARLPPTTAAAFINTCRVSTVARQFWPRQGGHYLETSRACTVLAVGYGKPDCLCR